MDSYYRQSGQNIGRGAAQIGNNLIKETRNLITELFHCPNKKVVFVSSATEALNIILQGLTIVDNFNIYISPFEHNAVVRVIEYLQTIYKLNVKELEVNKVTLDYDLEKIKYQFSEDKPNVVVISHASNVCGVLAPIEQICTMSKQYGAINVIDMCQTARAGRQGRRDAVRLPRALRAGPRCLRLSRRHRLHEAHARGG